MHLRARRILSALFFLLFILATPAIIISTAGYRYNFIKGRLERTGVMFVSTKPSNARVFLNDKEEKSLTPTRVRHLLPGKYDVRIEKDGYRPWTRTVEIRSRETSFLNNITLFRQGIPELALASPVSEMQLSEDGKYGAFISEEESVAEIHLLNLKTQASYLAYRTEHASEADLRLAWSKDSERLLIHRQQDGRADFFIWNKDEPLKLQNLREIFPQSYEQAFWSEEGRYIYAATERQLYLLDPRARTAQDIGPAVPNMSVLPSGFFGVFQDNGETVLVRRTFDAETFDVLGTLPPGEYAYVNGSHLGLIDESQERLLLIDPMVQPNELGYFEARASHAKWSEDEARIIYWNDLELHTYDPSTNVARLVTRLGTRIVDAAWLPDFDTLFFSDPETVMAIDGEDILSQSLTEIARFSSVRAFMIDPDGSVAWFIGAIGEKDGVWMMRIR